MTASTQSRCVSLADIPSALTWSDGELLTSVHAAFESRVLDALTDLVGAGIAQDAPAIEELAERVQSASEALTRVLLAPDVTARLLWRDERSIPIVAQYLCDCLTAEESRAGHRPTIGHPMWTALGDLVSHPSGAVTKSRPVAGVLPVDVDKPDDEWRGFRRYPEDVTSAGPLEPGERDLVLKRMTTAYGEVAASSPVLGQFVAQFAKVVALRSTSAAEATSFSSPNYIGRVNILNPQLLDEALLAEALVHESIHSFLFMLHEQGSFWGLSASAPGTPGGVVSPWSGRELPVSAYVQACCVWYGLLNFWALACTTGTKLPRRAFPRRLGQTLKGFLRGPLLDKIDPGSRDLLLPGVADAIQEMQRRVDELARAIA